MATRNGQARERKNKITKYYVNLQVTFARPNVSTKTIFDKKKKENRSTCWVLSKNYWPKQNVAAGRTAICTAAPLHIAQSNCVVFIMDKIRSADKMYWVRLSFTPTPNWMSWRRWSWYKNLFMMKWRTARLLPYCWPSKCLTFFFIWHFYSWHFPFQAMDAFIKRA